MWVSVALVIFRLFWEKTCSQAHVLVQVLMGRWTKGLRSQLMTGQRHPQFFATWALSPTWPFTLKSIQDKETIVSDGKTGRHSLLHKGISPGWGDRWGPSEKPA